MRVGTVIAMVKEMVPVVVAQEEDSLSLSLVSLSSWFDIPEMIK